MDSFVRFGRFEVEVFVVSLGDESSMRRDRPLLRIRYLQDMALVHSNIIQPSLVAITRERA